MTNVKIAVWSGVACIVLLTSYSGTAAAQLAAPTVPAECSAPRELRSWNAGKAQGESRLQSVWKSAAIHQDLDELSARLPSVLNSLETAMVSLATGQQPTLFVRCRAQDCDDSEPAVHENCCETAELTAVARATYNPKAYQDGVIDVGHAVEFTIPATLPLQSGCTYQQSATLTVTVDGQTKTCVYSGLNDRYSLPRCTGGATAGSTLQATRVTLHVEGLRSCRPTEVKISAIDPGCN